MRQELRHAVMFTVVTMLIFGGCYHAGVWGLANLVIRSQADGSLLRDAGGTVIGSRLIAQGFEGARYLHPRPSAVDYNAASMGGSNLGPSNPAHIDAVAERVRAYTAINGKQPILLSEMVTTSGGGLDPHVPPLAAFAQVDRIAAARGVPSDRVSEIITGHVESPALGVFGRARVNVLVVNLALDEAFGPPSTAEAASRAR